ncbi:MULTISPECIES: hypothetical protein [Olivibacter]|uniref:Uncharacterized protein n=1 Tax=Olivibacter jilunii TaxID=985016 RepID=A0ABW6B813_9SPHI
MSPFVNTHPSGINTAVLDFFKDRIHVQDDAFLFSYENNYGKTGTEYWSPGLHKVPVSVGIWLVHEGSLAQVRHLFLSHSAADILCFCQLSPDWLTLPGNVAFAALGLLAIADQVRFLKECFGNAKVHMLFDAEITGRVTDCKAALWLSGKDATFSIFDDIVQIGYRRRKFNIPVPVFSLHRFEKTVALRSNIRTHKPKGGFSSYYQLFVNSY